MHGAVALSAPASALIARGARLGGRSVRSVRSKATVVKTTNNPRMMPRVKASIQEPEPVTTDTWSEDDIDNIEFAVTKLSDDAAIANKEGAGATMAAPDWLTQLNRLWGGNSEIPVADAKLEDITGLLGGGLFQPLFKWMKEAGPVYLPHRAGHVLRRRLRPRLHQADPLQLRVQVHQGHHRGGWRVPLRPRRRAAGERGVEDPPQSRRAVAAQEVRGGDGGPVFRSLRRANG